MEQEPLFSNEYFDQAFHTVLNLPKTKRSVDAARMFHGWTGHKLEILRVYLRLYGRVAGNGTYIDGFAGNGQAKIDGQPRDGSVAVAFKSKAFKTLRCYERPRKAGALQRWVNATTTDKQRVRFTVVGGDFNENILVDLDSGVVPKDKPCFAFLDPDSTQLKWSTVRALAEYKADCAPPDTCKVELWILLNTWHALPRMMPRNGKAPQKTKLNSWLGGEAGWLDLYESNIRSPSAYAVRYANRLRDELGYGAALPIVIRDPKDGSPQYHMIHASDHKAAHGFMRWAALNALPADSIATPFPGLD